MVEAKHGKAEIFIFTFKTYIYNYRDNKYIHNYLLTSYTFRYVMYNVLCSGPQYELFIPMLPFLIQIIILATFPGPPLKE